MQRRRARLNEFSLEVSRFGLFCRVWSRLNATNLAGVNVELHGRSVHIYKQFAAFPLALEYTDTSAITFPQDLNPRADCEPLAVKEGSAAAHRPIVVFFQSVRTAACSTSSSILGVSGTSSGAGRRGLQPGAVG